MKVSLINSLFLLATLLCGLTKADKEMADDDARLQGRWVIVSAMSNGWVSPPLVGRGMVFSRGSVRFSDSSPEAKYKLDTTGNMHRIDIEGRHGSGPAQVIHGIYRFCSDNLTICFTRPGRRYPIR